MFLKRIELSGFKSFADKTIIQFDHEVTGIVGPNGCGKSNITDAIRWVLGEQSAKSLRGGSMSDVIFAGSAHRNAVNLAEVTLVFDNSNRNLNIEFDEVEITRKIHRNTNEGEYYINKTPCRLKDITNLIMDSGIGKDSLSVISQGNISSFADSKAEDRRPLFEEAAGVAKYKKRKNESLSKLNRTQDNLLRVEDIINELEQRVTPLKKAALKAEQYIEKKKELEKIEISVIVDEIEKLQLSNEEVDKKLFDLSSEKTILEATIQIEDQKNADSKNEISFIDKDINFLQEEFVKVVNDISALEARKVELDEKRKYALEYASNKEKLEQMKAMLQENEYEYRDRASRFENLKIDLSLNEQQRDKLENELEEVKRENNLYSTHLNNAGNRKEVLKNLLKQPFTHQQGVKAVLNAKESLYGIKGVVSQLLKPYDGYEEAISSALGAAMYHIVSDTSKSARHAIEFLKKNQSGRATFLPLNVLEDHYVEEDDLIVADHSDGFLGTCDQFIDNEEEFDILRFSLLGNVLVCDTLVHANELSKRLRYRYKIVTLEGDVVHKGGSMSGGKVKDSYSPLTTEKELKQVEEQYNKYADKVIHYKNKEYNLDKQIKEINTKIRSYEISIAELKTVVEVKKAKYEKLKDEYEQLHPEEEMDQQNVFKDDLVVQLAAYYSKRDDVTQQLKEKREKRFKLAQSVQKSEYLIRNARMNLNVLANEERDLLILKSKYDTKLENALNRLSSDYEMTYEHAKELSFEQDNEWAREEVLRLRNEIHKLGNVNLDAPSEFAEVNKRYETLISQRDELNLARKKILSAIDEMDEVMSTQFMDMFEKINKELDETFKSLFGGGKARLYLSNPEDVLNSGIEIDAQPPGKSIKNMQSLSGGEKSMIAMCVLFAILRARTMPLCIFDEVEAALDQANVERFAKYISRFSNSSQFLIVTHRPGTMTQCDALYGVTMKKNGVSQLLKVSLDDALAYVDKNKENE